MKKNDCLICFKDLMYHQDIFAFFKADALICNTCKSQICYINLHTNVLHFPLHILYEYNPFLETLIFQFKEGKDTALAPLFFYEHIKKISAKYRHYTIVLLPSSEESTLQRGFKATKTMLKECKLKIIEPFYKNRNYKQSKQHFKQRKSIENIIERNRNVSLPSTPLLLVDDVLTSGATLQWAYHLLSDHTLRIEALVLCAHPLFVETCDKKGLKPPPLFSILELVKRRKEKLHER